MKGLNFLINLLTAIAGLLLGIIPLVLGAWGNRLLTAISMDSSVVDMVLYFGIALVVVGCLNLIFGITAYAAMKHSLLPYTITELFLAVLSGGVFGVWLYGYYVQADYNIETMLGNEISLSVWISGTFFLLNALSVLATILHMFAHLGDKKKLQ